MRLPVIIHKEENSDFGVIIPDLPGVFASGPTLAEALADAREAVFLRFCDDKKCVLPHPSAPEAIRAGLEAGDDGWVEVLEIDAQMIAPGQ
ncbi:MAG: hypothetical protein HDQ91_01135 [Desulfovibrio sp.]|nr:hypothetical protein [Desulfovibrio sp.]